MEITVRLPVSALMEVKGSDQDEKPLRGYVQPLYWSVIWPGITSRYTDHAANIPASLIRTPPCAQTLARRRAQWPPPLSCPAPLSRCFFPSARRFSAALWSRCRLVPQAGQECGADGHALLHDHTAARTGLAGVPQAAWLQLVS